MTHESFEMKYSIGTNFDRSLVEFIHTQDQGKQIQSVFGKLRTDVAGGGRPSQILPELSMPELGDYIRLCHQNGLQFNYLVNPQCTGNFELVPSTHKKMLQLLGRLGELGVDAITVNSPYLCELIKKQFPQFKVTIGLYAMIYSLQHVKYWIELGADELTLHHRLNRNFPVLESLLKYTKSRGTQLRLIANNLCLHDCPYQINHGNGVSHASYKGHSTHHLYIDHSIFKCNYNKIKDPAKLISSDWIRPEDVVYYERLCEQTDNYNLSLKLVERTKPTEFLKRVVTAYLAERYDGNLVDILNWTAAKGVHVLHKLPLYVKAVTGGYKIKELVNFFSAFELPDMYIDNRKLDGFLEKFVKSFSCDSQICKDASLTREENGAACGYCANWAEKAVSFDDTQVSNWIRRCDDTLDRLNRSKIFV